MEILNEIQKMRKEDIKSHFETILKKAKTSEQINEFYDRIVDYLIMTILKEKSEYNYEGFNFWEDDIPLIYLILKEHNLKRKILKNLN